MYLTAHRVVSPQSASEAIHAFYRVHEDAWAGLDADPEHVPSHLVRETRILPGWGHRVRSYLDLIAPDRTSPGLVVADFEAFLHGDAPREFPCEFLGTTTRIRLGVERLLAASWRAEAQLLFYECLHVWISHPPQPTNGR